MGRLLKHIVNSDQRDYIIDKVNAPLLKAIVLLAGRYPKPTHENCVHPNTHILLDIEEQFFLNWVTSRSEALFRALFRIVEVKYEHSPNWRNMLDWAIMMVQRSSWKPFNSNRQMPTWRGSG